MPSWQTCFAVFSRLFLGTTAAQSSRQEVNLELKIFAKYILAESEFNYDQHEVTIVVCVRTQNLLMAMIKLQYFS